MEYALITLFHAFSPSLTWRDIQHLIAGSSKPLNPPNRSRRNPDWKVNNARLQGTDLFACKSRFFDTIFFAGSKWYTAPILSADHINSFVLIDIF